MNAWVATREVNWENEREPFERRTHNATHIFVCFFPINFFFFFVHHVQAEKKERDRIQWTVNTKMRVKLEWEEDQQNERKIQLSKHTISYYIWIVQCGILDAHVHFVCVWLLSFFPLPSHFLFIYSSARCTSSCVCCLRPDTCCLMDIL